MLIRISEDGAPTREVAVEGDVVTVGRSGECDIVLGAKTVSGRHLRLLEGLVVEDLGSRNGTFLDDRQIEGPEVCLGRRLTVGGAGTRLEILHPPGSPRAQVAEELARLRGSLASADSGVRRAGAVPAVRPSLDPVLALLADLAARDAAAHPTRFDGPVGEFYVVESFRFLRDVETVVTRIAGGLTSSAEQRTLLPDGEEGQNLRALLGDLLAEEGSGELREELIAHSSKILHWLLVAYEAHKQAAIGLVEEVREALRPAALHRRGPVPRIYNVAKLEGLVLWRRTQEVLAGLSQNYLLDRLDALARESARALSKDEATRR